jgi:hypothetical protein
MSSPIVILEFRRARRTHSRCCNVPVSSTRRSRQRSTEWLASATWLDMDVLRWVVESGYKDWIRLGETLGVMIRP